jgi:MoaA/NifB/PqqE/SkfB family radical SAM enzyme
MSSLTLAQPLGGATLSWDATRACNLGCGHCSNADDREAAARDLRLEEAAHMLAEFVEAGGVGLHLLGGEPLLRKDILTTIAVARELGLSVSLTTNGTVLPEPDMQAWLMEKLATLTVSLDGSTAAINDPIRGHGVFDRAIGALHAYRNAAAGLAARARLNVSHVLCAGNAVDVTGMIDCAVAAGADAIAITYLKPYGNALRRGAPLPADIPALRDAFLAAALHAELCPIEVTLFEVPVRMQHWLRAQAGSRVRFGGDAYCDTAEGQLRASSDGRVYPCFAGTKHHAKFGAVPAALDIAHTPLRSILADPFYAAFQQGAHEALRATPWAICQACPHFAARECYPGCPFEPENVKPRLCALLEAAS